MENKETLFYKILKARFFPYFSFLEAKDSASGSYAWKIILKGIWATLDCLINIGSRS